MRKGSKVHAEYIEFLRKIDEDMERNYPQVTYEGGLESDEDPADYIKGLRGGRVG